MGEMIDEYRPFRYGAETPESTAQAASAAALRTSKKGSAVLRWSDVNALPDTIVTDESKPLNQSAPLEALALEFTSPATDDSPSVQTQRPSTHPFSRSERVRHKRTLEH